MPSRYDTMNLDPVGIRNLTKAYPEEGATLLKED